MFLDPTLIMTQIFQLKFIFDATETNIVYLIMEFDSVVCPTCFNLFLKHCFSVNEL